MTVPNIQGIASAATLHTRQMSSAYRHLAVVCKVSEGDGKDELWITALGLASQTLAIATSTSASASASARVDLL